MRQMFNDFCAFLHRANPHARRCAEVGLYLEWSYRPLFSFVLKLLLDLPVWLTCLLAVLMLVHSRSLLW